MKASARREEEREKPLRRHERHASPRFSGFGKRRKGSVPNPKNLARLGSAGGVAFSGSGSGYFPGSTSP
jgi:hypothetical protein